MFTLHRWPRKRTKTGHLTGRPKAKSYGISSQPHTTSMLDYLYKKGDISESSHRTGLWYLRAWRLYTSAIEAPSLKTTALDPTLFTGHQWTVSRLKRIEQDWDEIQQVLRQLNSHSQSIITSTLIMDQPCENIQALNSFLVQLDRHMGRKSP
jgi:hypothetical protein